MTHRSPHYWIGICVITPVAIGIVAFAGLMIYVVARNRAMMNDLASIHDPRLRMARLTAAGGSPIWM